jgi:exopolyphosphatase / guanosine-5'-triphosphate,3'-diphosphate pyrophosphatase
VLETVAGVDLGSNSFHMIVARVDAGQLHVVDRLRERVRLAQGLDAEKNLTPIAMERALACLNRFGQRVRDLPQGAVRAAGTNTLRQAKNSAVFLERAQELLGHPIEIIAGREEARIIYLGVSHSVPADQGRRLVIDIGGGSTECILGEGFDSVATESLFMGCVSYTSRFFPRGELRREDFRRAETAAMLELRSLEYRYKTLGWQSCYGSSGTALAIAEILSGPAFGEQGVTRKGLKKLRAALVAAGDVSRLELPGLDADRALVLPGGLAILMGAFKSLGIEKMEPAFGALREGLLYDLLGRVGHEDVRERTIRWLAERNHADSSHAARVERIALYCLEQAAVSWSLDRVEGRQYLTWASRLHEIGLEIAHTGYHRHGAYIIENADMPGFSKGEQKMLAAIVHAHRRKFHREEFAALGPGRAHAALRLALLFRIAWCLNRSRSTEVIPPFALRVHGDQIRLELPEAWLAATPLIQAELRQERELLADAGVDLQVPGLDAEAASLSPASA